MNYEKYLLCKDTHSNKLLIDKISRHALLLHAKFTTYFIITISVRFIDFILSYYHGD